MNDKCTINGTIASPCKWMEALSGDNARSRTGVLFYKAQISNVKTLKSYERTVYLIKSGEHKTGIHRRFCPGCGTDFEPMYLSISAASAEAVNE